MFKVLLFSLLLLTGLTLSQLVPRAVGPLFAQTALPLHVLTMTALAFIMIQVGYDFEIDKRRLRAYGFDYLVAMTAAGLPWILCTLYFVFVMVPSQRSDVHFWERMLLLSRFAAPTSAGVLFSMLTAAGLSATWVFHKARVLAIFDDVDTIIAIVLIQMVMVGVAWQLGIIIAAIVLLLWTAWHYLRAFRFPQSWRWTLLYAGGLALACEGVAYLGSSLDSRVPLRVEVLLPAFVLGCTAVRSNSAAGQAVEQRAIAWVTGCFMVLAGASMPLVKTEGSGVISPLAIAFHVIAITLLSNLGKMFPALCYRREASFRERLALAVSMFPRGEVGTGVLVISLAYGIGGAVLTVATLSLALNLIGTGLFIVVVKWLLAGASNRSPSSGGSRAAADPIS
jgi:Kef-type K+ transport system membrane component KefB